MAWDGFGTFNRDYNWVNDRDAAIDITASRMDAEFDNFATGIQACVAKNGENAATANLPMGGFKHTNVAASTARTDYARVAELVDNTHTAKDAGGTANAQTLTPTPAISAYTKYQRFSFIPVADNTGACTLDVSELGAKSIKHINGTDPGAADLDASGIAEVMYDGTNFVLLSTGGGQSTGTWTPRLDGATTPGTMTYTVQNGTYIKTGKMLTLFAEISVTAVGTCAGILQIQDLPFAVKSGVPSVVGNVSLAGVSYGTGYATISQSGTHLGIKNNPAGGSGTNINVTALDIAPSSTISFCVTYETA